MDRNAIAGLVLIASILIIFSWLNPQGEEAPEEGTRKKDSVPEITQLEDTSAAALIDSASADTSVFDKQIVAMLPDSVLADSINIDSIRALIEQQDLMRQYGPFYSAIEGNEEIIEIGNKHLRISISTKGAVIKQVALPEYLSYRDYQSGKKKGESPLVIADSTHRNVLQFTIVRDQPMVVTTDNFYFELVAHDSSSARLRLNTNKSGSYLEVVYRLGKYDFEVDYKVEFHQMASIVRPAELEYIWKMNSPDIEKSVSQQTQISGVFYQYKGESRDYLSEMEDDKLDIEARPEWIAFKQLFFSAVLINKDDKILKGGTMGHEVYERNGYIKKYAASFNSLNIENTDNDSLSFSFYFGPNEYTFLEAYDNGMHRIVNYGPSIFGWLNRNFFQPVFNWLSDFGLNMGIVILLLTIIVRIIITPLVFRNYKSSAKMKVLKPEVEEIGKKYPDKSDAMKKQQEVMALYRSTGVNPLAGCVPLLIQMPILFAMFRFIPSVFAIRQKSFLWAEDLSAYDSVASLGFDIPFYGDHVSLFALLMSASTLAYTLVNSNQITPQAGMPNMKWMMYLFPVMMVFFFNNYSSGLSYYYLLGNLMSMGIMLLIKKYFIDENKIRAALEANKKKPKKMSKFQQRLQDMQKQQQQRAQQGRSARRKK